MGCSLWPLLPLPIRGGGGKTKGNKEPLETAHRRAKRISQGRHHRSRNPAPIPRQFQAREPRPMATTEHHLPKSWRSYLVKLGLRRPPTWLDEAARVSSRSPRPRSEFISSRKECGPARHRQAWTSPPNSETGMATRHPSCRGHGVAEHHTNQELLTPGDTLTLLQTSRRQLRTWSSCLQSML